MSKEPPVISPIEPTFCSSSVPAGFRSRMHRRLLRGCRFGWLVWPIFDWKWPARSQPCLGPRRMTNVDKMVHDLHPTAAIVCTPPSTHPDICVRLMEQGVHVLCEKPLAISTEEAIPTADTAERCHVTFSMGSKFRFVADVQKAREIIDSGILGDIILYENTFAGFCDMSQRRNSQPEISGGGVVIDNGTHSVDILRYLLGNITELQVVEGRRIQKLPVEDTALLFARTESGAMGNIDLSWSLNKVRADFVSIYGSKGTLSVGWKESKYKLAEQKDWTIFGNGYDKVAAFGNQIRNFGAAICGTERSIITPEDAIASGACHRNGIRCLANGTVARCDPRSAVPPESDMRTGVSEVDPNVLVRMISDYQNRLLVDL